VPFPETFYGAKMLLNHMAKHGNKIDPQIITNLQQNAGLFRAQEIAKSKTKKRWFAYIFDEVHGSHDTGAGTEGETNLAAVHAAADQVYNALHSTKPSQEVQVLWTSHGTPEQWESKQQPLNFPLWWSPAADALAPDFFVKTTGTGSPLPYNNL